MFLQLEFHLSLMCFLYYISYVLLNYQQVNVAAQVLADTILVRDIECCYFAFYLFIIISPAIVTPQTRKQVNQSYAKLFSHAS